MMSAARGGRVQWQLSQGTGKISWCKSSEDFFFLILSITTNEPQKKKKLPPNPGAGGLHVKTSPRKSLKIEKTV